MLVMTSRNCIESSRGDRNYRTAALPTIPSSLQSTTLMQTVGKNISTDFLFSFFPSLPFSLSPPLILFDSVLQSRFEWGVETGSSVARLRHTYHPCSKSD